MEKADADQSISGSSSPLPLICDFFFFNGCAEAAALCVSGSSTDSAEKQEEKKKTELVLVVMQSADATEADGSLSVPVYCPLRRVFTASQSSPKF